MKKIISLMFCLMLIFSSQLAFAETEKYYNIDIESCDEIIVSYYNGGEFSDPLTTGYYKYYTTDSVEKKDILKSLSNIKLIPFDGGFFANGGESLNIYVDGEIVVSFYLSSTKNLLCRTPDKFYYFSIEEYRKLEDVVLSYKTKNDTKVYLDNKEIRFYNSPIITNDRTLVPAEFICETLGLEVGWGGDRVILRQGDKSLVIYNDRVYENKTFIPIDVGYQIVDELAMIPIRRVAEFFGYDVKWENECVYIISK